MAARPDHHIAAIAHHFLAAEEPDQRPQPPCQQRDFAVLAAHHCRDSALAAAWLATTVSGADESADESAARPQRAPAKVTLWDDPQTEWTAESFVLPALKQANEGRTGLLPDLPGIRWRISGPAAGRAVSSGGSDGPTINWHHLGVLGVSDLAAGGDESAARLLANLPVLARDGLVWCLAAGDQDRLWPVYQLGRMLQWARPARLEVLVVADASSKECAAGNLAGSILKRLGRTINPGPVDRGAALIQKVAGGIPVQMTRVPLGDARERSAGLVTRLLPVLQRLGVDAER